MSQEIRAFRSEDTESVVELWNACGLTVPWNDPRRDIDRKLRVRAELFLVAIQDDRIVGSVMAGYEGHRGWINYLAVHPTRQRAGIGTSLMEQAERLLREAGCPKINLQVRRSNLQAIGFYESVGFREDDVVSLGKRLVSDGSSSAG